MMFYKFHRRGKVPTDIIRETRKDTRRKIAQNILFVIFSRIMSMFRNTCKHLSREVEREKYEKAKKNIKRF